MFLSQVFEVLYGRSARQIEQRPKPQAPIPKSIRGCAHLAKTITKELDHFWSVFAAEANRISKQQKAVNA